LPVPLAPAESLRASAAMAEADAKADSLPAARADRTASVLMLLMFLLSGAAALIYQIVWAKELSLVFGVTIYAQSAVVTTFMAGLALGSLYFGRVVDRWRRPLVLFALLEVGIGAFGLFFPYVAEGLKPIYAALYGPLGRNHYVMSLVRFVLSFLVLIVPTSLMGGTLPVLSRAYVTRARRLGKEVAGLYSANNLGAFAGCMLAGYVMLEFLGLRGTLAVAAGLNAVVAVVSLALAIGGTSPAAPVEPPGGSSARAAPLPGAVKVALWVFGIEGFTSLAYQISWTRLLIFFIEANIYAITAIVATFLVGLALGAFLVRRWVDRTDDPYRLLGLIELGIALTALATIPLLPWMMRHYVDFQRLLWRWGWAGWTLARFTLAFLVILVPTTFMGATMPVVSRIYVPALRGLGRKMGVIGCLDTLGSIFGAFAGGFIMIPLLGIQRTIVVTALINLALAVWVLAADPRRRRAGARPRVLLVASLVALALAPLLLLVRPRPLVLGARALRPLLSRRLLSYEEDVESTVSVVEAYGASRMLFVNHAGVAQTALIDRISHDMVAHVPLLCHPAPERILLIGFGIGFTSRAALVHGVEVDVVELSAGVREANRWFAEQNGSVLAEPDLRLFIDDGRNYVLGTQQKYDIVQAGIIHPAVSSGNAAFYTVDFYEESKRVLKPGGIMCQWLPLHMLPHEDFKMLIRSFQAVYPHTAIWYKNTSQYCTLVGTEEPLSLDFQDVERRVNEPALRRHLDQINLVDVYDFLDTFTCADERVASAIGRGPTHSDDHPYVEFHSQRPVALTAYAENVELLGLARQRVLPRLRNIPAGRRKQIAARLERWWRGTNRIIEGQYFSALMRSTGSGEPDFQSLYGELNARFRQAVEINPEDVNADFQWRNERCLYELRMAQKALREGWRAEGLERLQRAMQAAPGTFNAAEARYVYERHTRARPISP
jgi:spermidine synthase